MLTFYFRPKCGLCREIEGPMLQYAARYHVAVRRVNIDEDKNAFASYWDKIPVIEITGGPILYEPIDREVLKNAIREVGSAGKEE
jgi:hypothetical protein